MALKAREMNKVRKRTPGSRKPPEHVGERTTSTEGLHEEYQGAPPRATLVGIQEEHQCTLSASLSPQLAEALTAAWPDLQDMLVWWRERQSHAQQPSEKFERATFHVAPRWIELIKREAKVQATTQAAIVNAAFQQYFALDGQLRRLTKWLQVDRSSLSKAEIDQLDEAIGEELERIIELR